LKTWDIIIAGAGLIGVSLALELRRRGADVLVLERGEPGRESSSAAAGMLAAADPETPPALRPLAMESARIFPEFVGQLESLSGMQVDFRRHGSIALLADPETPPAHRQLTSDELQRLEPSLQPQHYSAFFLQEDSVDPDLLMQAALIAAQKAGVELRSHTAVEQMRAAGPHVEVIAGGERLAARKAVNCCGAWSGAPVKPRKGQMLYLQPQTANLLTHVLRAPEVYLVPRSSGKILVGATVEDVGFNKTVEAETMHHLHRQAARFVPELASAKVVSSWAGLRPGTPDDLPVLGETQIKGIFIASGHFRNGILLAPATAKLMADLLREKPLPMDLSAFRPSRFAPRRHGEEQNLTADDADSTD